jgi:hypothetical protein
MIMPDPSAIFAALVTILAGLAVLAVLAFIIVWALLGIRRTIIEHRARTTVPTFDPSSRYWPEHSAVNVVESIVPPPAP